MMVVGHALEHVGVRFIESIGMKFEPATFGKANKDLLIESRDFILVIISTGMELMLVDRHPGPTEVLTIERLDLDCLNSCIDDLVREALLVLVIVARLKPEVVAVTTGCSLAFPAPLAFFPFLLPAVSFLPVHLDLEVENIIELAMDTSEILFGLDCDIRAVDSFPRFRKGMESHVGFVGIKRPSPVGPIPRTSRVLIPFITRCELTKDCNGRDNQANNPHVSLSLRYELLSAFMNYLLRFRFHTRCCTCFVTFCLLAFTCDSLAKRGRFSKVRQNQNEYHVYKPE
jgi:hypothetical protein